MKQVSNRIITTAQQLDKQGFGPPTHTNQEDDSWMYTGEQFHLVNSKTLNAFTTGGKHLYIYSELFEECKNEDELAAVMSHEYAHVYCRHVAKGMQRQELLTGAALAAAGAGYVAGGQEHGSEYAGLAGGAAAAGGQFVGMGFTRGDESQADQIGFQFYAHAGWDPQRFAGFFKTMIEKGYDTTPEMMSDHPKLANRVTAVNQWVQQLPPEAKSWRKPPIADEARFKQLQARAAQVGKTMKDDKSLKQAQLLLAAFPSCVSPAEQPDQKKARNAISKALQEQPQKKKQ
jgi:predicted Zn-dependent protease